MRHKGKEGVKMKEQLQKQREFFLSGATLDLEWRMEQLKNFKKALKKNELLLIDALKKDLGKPEYEIYTAELAVVYEELNAAIKHLYRWSEIHDVDTRIDQYPGKIHVHHVPKGLVLIISPWNYPVRLALIPLISAMAAGNAVALKPAALSKHTSAIIKQVLAETFPAEYINVYEGDIEVGRELLQEKFDHIFFSGNPKTGKEVMRAAAEHMTPVTLELGGKSPCIIEETADLTAAARRIIWGKCLNSGQTCVAPDYILIDRRLKDKMLIELKNAYQKLYPEGVMGSEDYGRMVDEAHFDKVINYLEQGDVVIGGQYDREKLKIEFTVLDNVDVDSPVMQDEIFGPILPIAAYDTIEEAMAFVRQRPTPLALYLFTRAPEVEKRIINGLAYGGGCVNDTILHAFGSSHPFGGVGDSGMGGYHGRTGFETFSHEKTILYQPNELTVPLRYPPYKKKLKLIRSIMR